MVGEPSQGEVEPPDPSKLVKFVRAGMEIAGGAVPFIGGILAAGASAWSENEQEAVNHFLRAQLNMMHDEMREKQRVLGEVIVRLDLHDEEIKKRIRSDEYQTILKKASSMMKFRTNH